ncbi:type 1 glutamine amidotransferase [Glaciibacter psychrotolerans]|uniref:GMP synthase-like glutamine amidotransferase n=1 Tax=Glaciibacter psychrotolerans TaxID=670054 RepID=A0A7Z0EB67_9MICO|nr:type 1 glutamine amidotransferase [Leifsonia psychrotolerans]NYJ18241.1 GMP synthase-like glutamine amidotransferase [Leifsonia psychrotolerans]
MTKILVVEHEANAGIGLVGERIRAAGIEIDVVGPEAGHDIPLAAEGYAGVVVLGGTPGPTDDDDATWLPRVRALISDSLETETPFLGICLGAQLLAVVAGGVVAGVRKGSEIGLSELALTAHAADDPLLHDLPSELHAMQWHSLEVHELPPGSTSLCSSDRCPNQAFRVGESAWGLQFHLEALAATAEEWARHDSADLQDAGLSRSQVIEPMRQREAELRQVWSTVADRWVNVVQSAESSTRRSNRVATA